MTKSTQLVIRCGEGKDGEPAAHPGATIRFCLLLALLLAALAPAVSGQALPAAEAAPISTGFALPLTAGTLQYAVSASESLVWGYYSTNGAASATNVTGDIAYISNSQHDPFSMVFSGGRAWSTGGQPSYSYVNLGLSQVVAAGKWNFVLSDSVSYLPGTAATGLSGVPGVGDLGVSPVQVGSDTGQGVLTNYSSRINNVSSGSAQRQITGKTSLNGAVSYSVARFLSNTGSASSQGLDSDALSYQGGASHQFDVRNTMGGSYSYSSYSFTGNNFGLPAPSFHSQTVSGSLTHQFSRKLGMSAAAGPQWTTIESTVSYSSLNLFVDASLSYAGKTARSSLAYVRNTNSGYGATGGATSDSVQFGASRGFFRVWSGAVTSSFTRTESLPTPGLAPYTFHTTLAAVQLSRAIARSLSVYGSYTLEKQATLGSVVSAIDLFTGNSQVVGFGVTYSPMSLHVGRP